MRLKVLGSSSKGNCYLLDNGKECLMIECGVPFKEVQKAVNFDVSRIMGVIISHEHGDHAKYVQKCLDAQIPVYTSIGTTNALGLNWRLVHPMKELEYHHIGNFTVQAFPVVHDAAQPFGFLINHKETGTVLFATDTNYLKYKFYRLNNILIECNYRPDIMTANLNAGRLPVGVALRTIRSHCSYYACADILKANDLREVNNIVLIHLSSGNSNAEEFRNGIESLTGKNVLVADSGLDIEFNKTPF